MADQIENCAVNNRLPSLNSSSTKGKDDFVGDKVHISETVISVNNFELQHHMRWHGNVKEYEASTISDNIKTELPSSEGQYNIINDNVEITDEISANDIKIEFDSGLLYCEHCEANYVDYCNECGMLVHILNKYALNNANSGARDDIPDDILDIQDCFDHTRTYALRIIPAGVKFGPFTGLGTTECPWEIKGEVFVLDKSKSKNLNWMQYVNPTRNTSEGNLHVFQYDDNIQ